MTNYFQHFIRHLERGLGLSCIAALCLVICSACDMAPEYKRVEMSSFIPDFFVSDEDTLLSSNMEMSQWWKQLDSPELNRMVAELLENNLKLEVAAARLAQAREQTTIATGVRYPEVSLNGSAGRSVTPTQTIASGALSGIGPDRIYQSQYAANVAVAWQVDIFGKLKSEARSSEAILIGTELDKEALKHALVAELVNRYIAIAAINKQVESQQDIVESYEHSLKAIKRRFGTGAESISVNDVHISKEQLATAKSNLNELENLAKEHYYAISLLQGKSPDKSASYKEFTLKELPSSLPKVIPISLIDRRPDLRGDEFRLVAANENVGVALADLYPDLTISADIGYRSDDISTLFKPEQIAGSVLAQMSQTIFGGGKLRALVRQNEAHLDELAADYKQSILEAVNEVETAIVAESNLNKSYQNAIEAAQHAGQAYYNAENRYKRGLLTVNELLDAKRRYLSASQQKTEIGQARWQNRVSLYLALGGDWFNSPIANHNTSDKGTS